MLITERDANKNGTDLKSCGFHQLVGGGVEFNWNVYSAKLNRMNSIENTLHSSTGHFKIKQGRGCWRRYCQLKTTWGWGTQGLLRVRRQQEWTIKQQKTKHGRFTWCTSWKLWHLSNISPTADEQVQTLSFHTACPSRNLRLLLTYTYICIYIYIKVWSSGHLWDIALHKFCTTSHPELSLKRNKKKGEGQQQLSGKGTVILP